MDCNEDDFINMDCNELLDWNEEQYSFGEDKLNELSSSLWDELNQEEDTLLYMLGEQTPAKQCLDFGYGDCKYEGSSEKSIEVCRESSVKRRRMLLFDSEAIDLPNFNEQLSSVIINSKARDESHPSHEPQLASQLNQAHHSGGSDIDPQLLDQTSGEWLSNCLDESNMLCDEMFSCGVSIGDIDISDYCNVQPEEELVKALTTPQKSTPSRIRIKSRRSPIQLPTTPTSVAYPFTLVKPCGVQGDVTLSDINHRIHTPKKPEECVKEVDEKPVQYPTSALSGKPVVAKTKIRTEGGRGSITITRTKG